MQVYDKLYWSKFMARHDLVWEEIPHSRNDAPFLGNGLMGATFYFSDDLKQLYINLEHSFNDTLSASRFSIGKIAMSFTGTVKKVNLRLDVYNARLFGEIITSDGRVSVDCMLINSTDCLLMEHNEYDGEAVNFSFISSAEENPDKFKVAKEFERGGICAYLQPLASRGGYCITRAQINNKFIICVNSGDDLKAVMIDSLTQIKKCVDSLKSLISDHVSWWNNYCKKCFISLDNGVYENFLYAQFYKLACTNLIESGAFDFISEHSKSNEKTKTKKSAKSSANDLNTQDLCVRETVLSLDAPISVTKSVLDMIIQSCNGYIDIFPALMADWENICFDGLLCNDGFEVGARLTDGQLEWIKITSKLGKKCKVKANFIEEPTYSNTTYKKLKDGKYVINVKEGETAILSCVPSPIIDFVKIPVKTMNCYGLNPKNKFIKNSEGK